MLNVYLVNLPLILLNYYKINVLSVVLSLVLSVPISFIYLFSIVYLFLDKFHVLYFITLKGLEKTFSFLSNFDLELVFGKPHIAAVLMYYLFLLLFFVYSERKKRIRKVYFVCALSVMLFQYFIPCFNMHEQVYFLNVEQGDCTVFIIPESKSAVLFDTGGSKYKDIAVKEIIPFLYSKGINKIDKVIISHDDYDHVGALESLQDNFDVGEIIENSMFKSVMIGKEEFVNLNVSEMRDNDGSVVLYGKYGGYDLLLMGDASSLIELKVMNNVNNVDILKVAHHGSRDSSCMEFLMKIRGKIAIISVGENNSYKHPHEEVLDNLNKAGYLMLRTDENNDIGFGRNLFGRSFLFACFNEKRNILLLKIAVFNCSTSVST
jgi:competence protein ComEC